MKIIGVGFIGAMIYSAGFFHGAVADRKTVLKKLAESKPLINKIVSDFVYEATTKKMSQAEMQTYLEGELDFFTLVFK